jgi:hypothetical protein
MACFMTTVVVCVRARDAEKRGADVGALTTGQ